MFHWLAFEENQTYISIDTMASALKKAKREKSVGESKSDISLSKRYDR